MANREWFVVESNRGRMRSRGGYADEEFPNVEEAQKAAREEALRCDHVTIVRCLREEVIALERDITVRMTDLRTRSTA